MIMMIMLIMLISQGAPGGRGGALCVAGGATRRARPGAGGSMYFIYVKKLIIYVVISLCYIVCD